MTKPSISFWVISVVALLWNLMGVSQYIQQAYNTESFRAMYTSEQLLLMDALHQLGLQQHLQLQYFQLH